MCEAVVIIVRQISYNFVVTCCSPVCLRIQNKAMNTILWTCQIILALLFLFSGLMKSTQSKEWLVSHNQTGVVGIPSSMIKLIGVSEIAGAFGITFPMWLDIQPVITPITAVCFAIIMILAAPIHYRLKEPRNVMINLIVMAISLFVAFMRFKEFPLHDL